MKEEDVGYSMLRNGMIKEISVIQDSGLLLYHKIIQPDGKMKSKDPVMFAGLMSALLAISLEVSNGIRHVDMSGDHFYFFKLKHITFIIRTQQQLSDNIIEQYERLATEDLNFSGLLERFSLMTVIPQDKEMLKVIESATLEILLKMNLIYEINDSDDKIMGIDSSIDDIKMINDLLTDINEGKMSKFSLARELFDKARKNYESDDVSRYVELLKIMLQSDMVKAHVKEKLKDVIELLNKSGNASSLFGKKHGDIVF